MHRDSPARRCMANDNVCGPSNIHKAVALPRRYVASTSHRHAHRRDRPSSLPHPNVVIVMNKDRAKLRKRGGMMYRDIGQEHHTIDTVSQRMFDGFIDFSSRFNGENHRAHLLFACRWVGVRRSARPRGGAPSIATDLNRPGHRKSSGAAAEFKDPC